MADQQSNTELNNSGKCTLFIGNLPYDTTNEALESTFSNIGPLKRSFVVSGKGIGFVTYALRDDAETAIQEIKNLGGRKLNISFANQKAVKKNVTQTITDQTEDSRPFLTNEKSFETDHRQKSKKKPALNKKGRLLVRNLSFQATEKDVNIAFGKYGNIVEVSIPKKKDGKKFGFCFVQMDNVKDAANAMKAMNDQTILGRKIAVDWSIPKNEYNKMRNIQMDSNEGVDEAINDDTKNGNISVEKHVKKQKIITVKSQEKKQLKPKQINADEDDVSDLVEESSDENESTLENDNDNSEGSDNKSEKMDQDESEGEQTEGDESDELLDEDEGTDDEAMDSDNEDNNKEKIFKSDANEGKTLFIRNISYDTSQEKLRTAFSQFGNTLYAAICIDPVTEHPKGSGFVKFRTKEDAEKCLKQAECQTKDGGISLDGQKLHVAIAVSKEELQKQMEEKKKKKKDNRNLYLAREGLIRPGTLAAEGVSKQDMEKRMQLEAWKGKMLKNLHMFVSKTRLSVKNIPPTVDEKKLRNIFMKAGGLEARLTEVKIMRDLKKIDANGIGVSKGFGFVNFIEHDHALKALRNINNNPNIFTNTMRPIVEFTIENQAVLKAKQRRQENSRRKSKQVLEKQLENPIRQSNKRFKSGNNIEENSVNAGTFVGTRADALNLEKAKTLPSHLGPKIRHRKRSANIMKKNVKTQITKVKEKRKSQRPPKKMPKVIKSEANLDRLVQNYKRKITSGKKVETKKSKWFESK